MRWNSSLPLVLAALVGCSGADSGERREGAELERALIAFSEAAPDDRGLRLEEIRGLVVVSERVRGVRRTCLAAYEAFFAAMARLSEVKDQAAEVEAESAKALAGAPLEGGDLSRMQAAALDGTRDVTAALDRAEALVDECTRRRARLARELGD
jgi:hypothetical protein